MSKDALAGNLDAVFMQRVDITAPCLVMVTVPYSWNNDQMVDLSRALRLVSREFESQAKFILARGRVSVEEMDRGNLLRLRAEINEALGINEGSGEG